MRALGFFKQWSAILKIVFGLLAVFRSMCYKMASLDLSDEGVNTLKDYISFDFKMSCVVKDIPLETPRFVNA